MNKTLNKSIKSYAKFLKSYFIRGFTFKSDMDNEAKVTDDRIYGENDVLDLDPGMNNNPENDNLKEEAILSPGKVATRNFFRNPLGVIGLIMYL